MSATQHEKILSIMFSDTTGKWFFPYDFMQPGMGDMFVGYEASARLSELAKEYPYMIESLRDGKYIKRRVRLDDDRQWLFSLPEYLKKLYRDSREKQGRLL
jgi:hypothetical protein